MNMKSLVRTRRRVESAIDDAVESVGGAAMRLTDEARDQFVEKVTKARRELADRIDPDPVPRRLRRWLLLGGLACGVAAAAAVVAGRLTRRRSTPEIDISENGHRPTELEQPDTIDSGSARSSNGGASS